MIKNNLVFRPTLISILLFTFSLSACTVFPESAPAKIYTLELPTAKTKTKCAVRFALREVAIPGYLDRAELVLGRNSGALEVSSQHLWAAPLGREMTRLIGQGITERLQGSRQLPFPLRQLELPDALLQVTLTRFVTDNQILKLSFTLDAANPTSGKSLVTGVLVESQGRAQTTLNEAPKQSSLKAQDLIGAWEVALENSIDSLSAGFAKTVCPSGS
jgi:uncharacterized lipoprotein YmbA